MAPVADSHAPGHERPGAQPGPARSWAVVCWVAILTLIGTTQAMRGQWFDTALFFTAAALTAVGPWLPGRNAGSLPLGRAVIGSIVVVGAGVSLLPRHSRWMAAALILVGVAAAAFAWSSTARSRPRWSPGLRRLSIGWATVLIAGCLWELSQFILGYVAPSWPAYALSDLIDPLLDSLPGKAMFVAVWLAGGVFLLRRGAGKGARR